MAVLVTVLSLLAAGASAQPAQSPTPSVIPAQPDPCNQRGHIFYPLAAIREGRGGITQLSFTIGIDGRPRNVTDAQSSGSPDLDAAAVQGAQCSRYRPAMKDGHAVEVEWKTQVNWNLVKPESWLDRLFSK